MPEKVPSYTDPNVGGYSGPDRVFHVAFEASQAFKRRGGKFVAKHTNFKLAVAADSNLAGVAEVEEITTTSGQKLPVNFAEGKTAVLPTTGRVAVEADRGKAFDIAVVGGVQHINLNASTKQVLAVSEIVDQNGSWVSAKIPPGKRYGNL